MKLAYRIEPLDRDGAVMPRSGLVHTAAGPVGVGTRLRFPCNGFEEWEVVRVIPPGEDRPDAPRIISARNAAGEDMTLGGTLVVRGIPPTLP